MSAFNDSSIKLFGKIIPLPVYCDPPLFSVHVSSLHQNHQFTNQVSSGCEEETTTTTSSSLGSNKKPKTSSQEAAEIESLNQTSPEKIGEEKEEGKEEKSLKKPEKILACPRCNSMDTKFCYYNNYNVNQPRHLCKKCQRYWTAGGSMRNVPVGAGRRKNKNSSAAHFRHLMFSESIRAAHLQASISGLQNPFYNSPTLLTFGTDQADILSHKEQVEAAGQVLPYSGGIFNGFSHSKSQERSPPLLLLQANPAALCRSLNFRETN